MWKAIVAQILGISKQLVAVLAPILAGALSDLLKKSADKATAFVKNAATDPTLATGEARHAWVVEQVKVLVKDTATEYLPAIREAVINLAVKSSYDLLNNKK